MAIKKVAKLSEEEQLAQDKADIEMSMNDAVVWAREIFGVTAPSLPMVYGILERTEGYDEDAQAIVVEQLALSFEAVKAKFGEAPAEYVFRHYDVFFEEDDEDDDE